MTSTRRHFIATCSQAGLSVAATSLLAACITKRDVPPPDEQPASAAGPLEKELRVFNWSDYVAPDTVPRFEREFGVRVTYDTYESNEEMIAKLVAGGDGYDVVGPTGYLVPVLAAGGLLRPLDHAVLPNWGNLLPVFVNAEQGGGRYSMPYQWGITGVAYRRDLVATAPTSWAVFSDAALRDRMTMLDESGEVFGAMLKWRGRSWNTTDRALLRSAKQDAMTVKPFLRAYVSGSVKAQLVSGDIAVAQLWSGDTGQATADEPRVEFMVPAEGSQIFADHLAIPRRAPNPRAAHAFLNYVLRPEVAAEIAEQTGYGPANGAAVARMKTPVPPPDATTMQRLEFPRHLDGAVNDFLDRLWTEMKAG